MPYTWRKVCFHQSNTIKIKLNNKLFWAAQFPPYVRRHTDIKYTTWHIWITTRVEPQVLLIIYKTLLFNSDCVTEYQVIRFTCFSFSLKSLIIWNWKSCQENVSAWNIILTHLATSVKSMLHFCWFLFVNTQWCEKHLQFCNWYRGEKFFRLDMFFSSFN